jgi:hypothetical protein
MDSAHDGERASALSSEQDTSSKADVCFFFYANAQRNANVMRD